MQAEALLNAYIDLNLLVLVGAGFWFLARTALARSTAAHAFRSQLRLLNSMPFFLSAAPFVALCFNALDLGHAPTLSDVLVAQYLQGNVNLSAAQFEGMIGLRDDAVRTIANQSTIWSHFVLTLGLGGAFLSLASFGRAVWHVRCALQEAFLWKRIGRLHLMISETAPVAYSTRGLWHLYVVIPDHLLSSPEDLRLTLAHELQHFRQKDVEMAILLELLRPVLFWNPAFYLWRRDIRSIRELACDQALGARNRFDARAYCECLIRATRAAQGAPGHRTERGPVAALLDPREIRQMPFLARRILAVTKSEKTAGHGSVWAMVCGLFILVVLSTALFIQRPADWSHDRIMLSTLVNLERMAAHSNTSAISPPWQGGAVAPLN